MENVQNALVNNTASSELFSFKGASVKDALEAEGYKFKVNNTRGRGIGTITAQTFATPGVDGVRYIGRNAPEREIEVDYTLECKDLTALRKAEKKMFAVLNSNEPEELRFEDQDGYFKAVLTDSSVSLETHRVQQGTLIFLCPEPFLYGEDVETTARNDWRTNYHVHPLVEIKPTNDTVIISTGGRSLTIENASGGNITIDFANKEVKQGEVLKVLDLYGRFPIIMEESMLNTSGADIVKITYKARWL